MTGAALTAQAAGVGSAQGGPHSQGKHRHHGLKHSSWIESAERCIGAGEACQAHCIQLVGAGDTSIAECLKTVTAMVAICKAVPPVAALETGQVKALAALCANVCKECKKACDEHADKHAECKRCSDACAELIQAAEKVAA